MMDVFAIEIEDKLLYHDAKTGSYSNCPPGVPVRKMTFHTLDGRQFHFMAAFKDPQFIEIVGMRKED